MKLVKYGIFGGFSMILLLTISCSKQLDQKPPSAVETSLFYSNTQDFTQAVTGAYNQLHSYPDQVLWMGEMRSDNINATSDGNRDWQGIRNFSSSLSSVGFITAAWDDNFNGIYNTNSVLDNLATKGSNITTPGLAARFSGECHFLRAFYYFQLLRLYGQVPIVPHALTVAEVEKIKRSPVSDVYSFIISDLDTAIALLPGSYGAADVGRATKWSAEGLLGLVYLTRSGPAYSGVYGPTLGTNEWDSAEAHFNNVINSGQFQFLSNYPSIFSYTNEDNREVVFNVEFMSTNNGADYPSQLTPQGYWNGLGLSGYGNGYGTTTFDITSDLTKSYANSAAGKVDQRDTFNIAWSYPKTLGGAPDSADPFIKKYINPATGKRGTGLRDWPINFIVMRYTDVLMMKAEAILHGASGPQSTVDSIVNLVRTRAGIPTTSNVTLPQLMEERRREFLGEGIRWNDLVREGMAVTTMNSWIASDTETLINQVVPNYVIYPVPSSEILTVPGLYTQNPGYQ